MPGGKLGAGERLQTHVMADQRLARPSLQAVEHAGTQSPSQPRLSQPPEFQSQVGELLRRIAQSQPAVELQAVDHCNGRPEPDVLGAQVAVSLHHLRRPRTEGRAPQGSEVPLQDPHAPHAGTPGRMHRKHFGRIASTLPPQPRHVARLSPAPARRTAPGSPRAGRHPWMSPRVVAAPHRACVSRPAGASRPASRAPAGRDPGAGHPADPRPVASSRCRRPAPAAGSGGLPRDSRAGVARACDSPCGPGAAASSTCRPAYA